MGIAQTRHARNTSSKQGLSETELLPIISFVEDVLLQVSVGGEINLHYQISLTSSHSMSRTPYHGERNVSGTKSSRVFKGYAEGTNLSRHAAAPLYKPNTPSSRMMWSAPRFAPPSSPCTCRRILLPKRLAKGTNNRRKCLTQSPVGW